MKHKDLVKLARKIAEAEKIIQTSSNKEEVNKAQQRVIELSGQVKTIEEMLNLDEILQEFLKEI